MHLAATEVEALRERLYAPDASPEDLERYRSAQRVEPRPEPRPESPPAVVARPRRGRTVGVAAVLVVLAVAATVLGTVARPPAPAPSPRPPAPPELVAEYETLAVPPAARAAFVQEVRRGHPIGLQQWFTDHPGQQPRQIVSGLREESVEQAGTGSAVLDIPAAWAASAGGRLTLVLTVDRAATARWSLVVPGNRDDGRWIALDEVQAEPGLPAVASLPVDPLRPTSVAITLPVGARWDVMTIFTD